MVVGERVKAQHRVFDSEGLALLQSCSVVIRGVGKAAEEESNAGTAEASAAERGGCRIRRALPPWL